MPSRQTKLSPLLRSFAAAALVVWLAAQVLCTAHCNFGVCHGDSEHASCHDGAAPQPHHDDGDSPAPVHDDSATTAACLALKSALVGGGASTLVQPQLFVLYTLPPLALALEVAVAQLTAPFSRHARPCDWVFTPEVSLGPAHRCHAPPFLG